MNIYEQNVEFLKREYPEIAALIEGYKEDGDFETVMTKNGEVNLKLTVNNKLYFLHSKYNAKEESVKWLESVKEEINKNGQILLFGTGMGYFLDAVIKYSNATHVIVYEPNIGIFNQMIRSKDIRCLLSDDRIKMLAVGCHEYVIAQIAHSILKMFADSISLITTPIYLRIFKETYKQLQMSILSEVNNDASNLQTYQMFQKTWLKNILFNLPYTINHPSATSLKGSINGGIVIIVGSGPSLQKDIHYLKKIRNKCFIIAAGSSIQALQYFDLDPDLVVTIDGGIPNYKVFKNIDTSRTPLLFTTQVHHKIAEVYRNDLLYAMFSNDQVSEYMLREQQVLTMKSSSSVTGTALQLAAYMGAKEIILMGQDLSYPEKTFYTPGVNHITEERKQEVLNSATEWVENVNGGMNPTTKAMEVTRKDIGQIVKLLAFKGLKVVNSSDGGAVIDGASWISMKEKFIELEALPDHRFNINEKILPPTIEEQNNLYQSYVLRFNCILQELEAMKKKLSRLEVKLNKLNRDLKIVINVNQSLQEINNDWQIITSEELFVKFYSYGLAYNINKYMKMVPLIVETKEPLRKAKLISQYLGDLVREMVVFTPELEGLLIQSQNRLNVFAVNNRLGDANNERTI
ncbi:6-hydroxymethylpterin diphosphokinase MptE-like protein [Paenibacillus lentus]|uniref:motility associated factor glycosyltransferase family protein n=1 Tax=Paenibacillus lentus TaxID=1338368 RepID=UPI003655EDEA